MVDFLSLDVPGGIVVVNICARSFTVNAKKNTIKLNVKYGFRINLRLYCSLDSTVFDESPVDATSDIDVCSIDGERTPGMAKRLF